MRIRFASLVLMISAVAMLSSCMKDDNDTTYDYYTDTAVSSFTLGSLNRYLHTTSASGADSLYKTTYSGSNYKMTIDQVGHRIYNTDSLPYGTDAKHVLATITAVNSGVILLRSAVSDSLFYYSNTDSIDFSTPRTLRIVAQDGQRYADYTVSLNVRQVPEGTLAWQEKTTSQELAQLTNIKAVSVLGKVIVYGQLNGKTVGYSTAYNEGTSWIPLDTALSANTNVVAQNDKLYAIDNGRVISSYDGDSWTEVAASGNLLRIVAASTKHIYALTTSDGQTPSGMASSADGGATWTTENIDADASLLPDDGVEFASTPIHSNDSIDQVMIVGRCSSANNQTAQVWTKLDDYSGNPISSDWSYVDNSGKTTYALGDIPTLTVAVYGGYPVALVGNGTTVSKLLRTVDGGLSWKDSGNSLPDGLTAVDGKLTMMTDVAGSLWIISDGHVWKN